MTWTVHLLIWCAAFVGSAFGSNCNDPEPMDLCDPLATTYCDDSQSAWSCECNVGYTGDGLADTDGCTDIDECQLDQDDCHQNADCTNTDGDFMCNCSTGYTGDGLDCQVTAFQVDVVKENSALVADSFFKKDTVSEKDYLFAVFLHDWAHLQNPGFDLERYCRIPRIGLYANSRVDVVTSPTFDEMTDIIQNKNRRTQYFRAGRHTSGNEDKFSAVWSNKCFVSRNQNIGPYVPPLEVSLAAWAAKFMRPIPRDHYLLIYSTFPPCGYPGGSGEDENLVYCLRTVKAVVQGELNKYGRDYTDHVIYISDNDADFYLVYDFVADTFNTEYWADGLNLNDFLP